jgi:formate-dependent nitrite reductase cytochrome c552 subunit
MKRSIVLFVLLAVALLFVWGCERKVTNEITQVTQGLNSEACMKCHNDESGALLQAEGEWQNSIHASGNNVDYTNRGGVGTDCTKCHDQQGFIKWLDSGIVAGPYDNVSAIGCFTCHDPHTRGDMSLRIESAYTLANAVVFDHGEGNLCANCHHIRTDVRAEIVDNKATTNRFGPHHGPQADLLQATGGYQYAGMTYNTSTHGTAVDNSCIGCHMGNPQVHDGYKIGGHSWNMEDEESGYNLIAVCTPCHAKAKTDFDFVADTVKATYDFDKDGTVEGYQTEMKGIRDSLAVLLIAKSVLTRTVTGTDTTYAPKTATIVDKGITGAVWNLMLVQEEKSWGIHNFKYEKDLLWNSITYVLAH